MILNGSLHEFILADIFQLLHQQKATGKLTVTCGNHNGAIVLYNGKIAAAEENHETLQSKMFNCLRTVKKINAATIETITRSYGGSTDRLCSELVNKGLFSPAEISAITQMVIEDLSCSIFSWSKGTYRFESLDNVSGYLVPGLVLSPDSVVMEAMRRIDEETRARIPINDNTIFVLNNPGVLSQYRTGCDALEIIKDPNGYILRFIDSLSTVRIIAQRALLTKYQVKEALRRLCEQDIVAPLSPKVARSIQAAMSRRAQAQLPGFSKTALAAITCFFLLAILGLLARGVSRLQEPLRQTSANMRSERNDFYSHRMLSAASLHYRAETGTVPLNPSEMVTRGYLSHHDIAARKIPLW